MAMRSARQGDARRRTAGTNQSGRLWPYHRAAASVFDPECDKFVTIATYPDASLGSERLPDADVELKGVVGIARIHGKADIQAQRPDRTEIAQARPGADPKLLVEVGD